MGVFVLTANGGTTSQLKCCVATNSWGSCATGAGSGTVTSVGLSGTAHQIAVTGTSPVTASGAWTAAFPADYLNIGTPSATPTPTPVPGYINSAGGYYVNGVPVLVSGGALGTPSSGTLTSVTGLPVAGIASMSADNIVGNFTASPAVPGTQAIPACANDGAHALVYASHALACESISGGSGTVTSVGLAGTSGHIAVSGTSPITGSGSWTLDFGSISADNIFGNFTGSAAVPSTQAIPSCANDGSHALVYASHTLACEAITGGGGGGPRALYNPTGAVAKCQGNVPGVVFGIPVSTYQPSANAMPVGACEADGLHGYLDFTASTAQIVTDQFRLPSDWAGTLKVFLSGWSTSTSAPTISIQLLCISTQVTSGGTYGTAQTISLTPGASSHRTPVTTTLTTSATYATKACAAGDLVQFQLTVTANAAADLMLVETQFTE